VLNSSIEGDSVELTITSYIAAHPDDINIDIGLYGGRTAAVISGSRFLETSENPWQETPVYTLYRDREGQSFTVSFPQRLNIVMEHENFTSHNPVISWDAYPNAKNGYFVVAMVKDKEERFGNLSDSGNDVWALAFYGRSDQTSIGVSSNHLFFSPIISPEGETPPPVQSGDVIRIEVYVLDGSDGLDMKNKTGAMFMDSVNIVR
jgi:hypothetical protein